ncbi:MAG: hypothetical protein ACXADA_11710 [Candidatus Hodarchaeales archaeon]
MTLFCLLVVHHATFSSRIPMTIRHNNKWLFAAKSSQLNETGIPY